MSECIYQTHKLTKDYGKVRALDGVDLTLEQGRIIGLLGKNGAGKSTLMRCLLGFLAHEGEVTLGGKPASRHDHRLFEEVAFIPDVSGLDDRLTVKQTMEYVRGLNPRWNEAMAEKLFALSSLPADRKVGKLSKGMKTKLYLLLTLSLDVRFLLLDEPTLGLDIAFRKEFFSTILGEFFDESRSILISTHQIEEVEDVLQEIIFIDRGKIILHEEVESLKERFRIVSLSQDREAELKAHNPRVISRTLGFVSAVLPSDLQIEGAMYARPSLADIFLAYVGGTNEAV